MIWFLSTALIVTVGVVVETWLPGRPAYHAGWYNIALTALAIAGAAGFILGGGASSRLGLAALAMVGKIALRGAATNFLVGLFVPNPDQGSRRAERTRPSRRRNQEKQDSARA